MTAKAEHKYPTNQAVLDHLDELAAEGAPLRRGFYRDKNGMVRYLDNIEKVHGVVGAIIIDPKVAKVLVNHQMSADKSYEKTWLGYDSGIMDWFFDATFISETQDY